MREMSKAFLIASDIHGSSYYCRLLIELFEKGSAENMLLLGDILYHGPRNALPREYDPMACASLLRPYSDRIACIGGNCDAEIDEDILGFEMLRGYAKLFSHGRYFTATHGHLFNAEHLPPIGCGETLLYGHYHVPSYRIVNGITLLNPGSVSIPKEDSPCSCVLFDGESFTWYDLDRGIPYMRKDPVFGSNEYC